MGSHLVIPGRGVDFHMHTLASDGLWSAETLVETAVQQGIRAMTVSDHDTINNVGKVKTLAEAQGIRFVPGVEVTVNLRNTVYHLLLLNFDPANPELNKLLNDTQARVYAKKQEMIAALTLRGYRLHRLGDFKKEDGEYLAIDIARALVRGQEVPTFDRALHVCREVGLDKIITQPVEKTLEIGLAAGATPVLAHPARAEFGFQAATDKVLEELTWMGLAGVEVYHYAHSQEDRERLQNFARRHNLAVSCGSDSHNEARKPMAWNPDLCRSLLERLDLTIEEAAA